MKFKQQSKETDTSTDVEDPYDKFDPRLVSRNIICSKYNDKNE